MAEDDRPLFHELEIPPDAREKGGHEILRASVVDGDVSVALRRSFEDPFTWGVLLVDLARHVARVYALEGGTSEAETPGTVETRRSWSASAHPSRTSSSQ